MPAEVDVHITTIITIITTRAPNNVRTRFSGQPLMSAVGPQL